LGAPALLDHVLSKDKVDLTTICEDKTILQYAIKYGDNVLVQKLIKAGADPHQQSYNGKTALDYAKKYDKPVIAGLLKSLHK